LEKEAREYQTRYVAAAAPSNLTSSSTSSNRSSNTFTAAANMQQQQQQQQQQQRMTTRRLTRRQSSMHKFNSVVQKLHENNSSDWAKQNCHFCGRCRPLKERYTCQNQYCSLQGQRVKYMCKLCYEHQENYFAARGLDVKNIFGDVHSPEWSLPTINLLHDTMNQYDTMFLSW